MTADLARALHSTQEPQTPVTGDEEEDDEDSEEEDEDEDDDSSEV